MRNPRSKGPATARWVIVPLVAIAFLWPTLAITESLVARGNPAGGLGLWNGSATQAAAAYKAATDPNGNLGEARGLAEASLVDSPVSIVAARALAILAARDNDTPRAERLFRYAETLSRRDLPTELWLIESNVQRNDIAGALRHYDRALRVTPEAGGQLFPILISASANEEVRRPLFDMLAQRPPWFSAFTVAFVGSSQSPRALFDFVQRARLNANVQGEREALTVVLTRLAQNGDAAPALALYEQALPHRTDQHLLRNGDFQADDLLPPFDWSYSDNVDLDIGRRPLDAGRDEQALHYLSSTGADTVVARQILVLPAGRYQLGARLGGEPGDRQTPARVTMSCLGGQRQSLIELRWPRVIEQGAEQSGAFTVPAGCTAQAIAIVADATVDQRRASWINAVSVRTAPSAD